MTATLQNVFYRIDDMDRADRFYRELLGADLKFADGDRWRQYDLNGRKFALASDEEAHPQMHGAAMVFEVGELEEAKAKAVALGGEVLQVRDMGAHGITVVLADSEGNILHLWKRPA